MRKTKRHYLYSTFYNMIGRCNNPKIDSYPWYGARGIKVCDRWMERPGGFENFLEDMGERPKGFQLDRIDSDKDYSPENCKWSSKYEQMANIRSNNKDVGVGWHKQRKKWRARIKNNGKDISLGLFHSYEDAVKARKLAEIDYV